MTRITAILVIIWLPMKRIISRRGDWLNIGSENNPNIRTAIVENTGIIFDRQGRVRYIIFPGENQVSSKRLYWSTAVINAGKHITLSKAVFMRRKPFSADGKGHRLPAGENQELARASYWGIYCHRLKCMVQVCCPRDVRGVLPSGNWRRAPRRLQGCLRRKDERQTATVKTRLFSPASAQLRRNTYHRTIAEMYLQGRHCENVRRQLKA